ncbi:hypothetical protein PG996_015718 [Apiospora saccharicola]|uniref:Uncharacterized protein n=1 Tax=Apiospora saccharicola TaxID=335842 RepID=A0ABR1TLY0_9PEZI
MNAIAYLESHTLGRGLNAAIKKGQFPFLASGRSKEIAETDADRARRRTRLLTRASAASAVTHRIATPRPPGLFAGLGATVPSATAYVLVVAVSPVAIAPAVPASLAVPAAAPRSAASPFWPGISVPVTISIPPVVSPRLSPAAVSLAIAILITPVAVYGPISVASVALAISRAITIDFLRRTAAFDVGGAVTGAASLVQSGNG